MSHSADFNDKPSIGPAQFNGRLKSDHPTDKSSKILQSIVRFMWTEYKDIKQIVSSIYIILQE